MTDQNFNEDPFDPTTAANKETLDRADDKGAESFGEAATKIATEAGYAVAGFAGLVGEKAKAFYEEQKKQYADSHPEAEKDPGAKAFLDQLSEHLKRFVDDLNKGFKDMAERGRDEVKRTSAAPGSTHADQSAGSTGPASDAAWQRPSGEVPAEEQVSPEFGSDKPRTDGF